MSKTRTITPNPPADFVPSKNGVSYLRPFRVWCQKVLPLVYDDSLSYYELLCKVVDYLNKTMEEVNQLGVDVSNVFNAFQELQDYVNNYFSTLDVQEEINNKLDDMAESGELGNIISKITQSYAINVVFAGVKNDGTDCTEDLQTLVNNNPNGVLYFPPGNYTFYDIDGKECSLIFSNNAVISGDSTANNWFFKYTNASHVSISGGVFKRGTENSKNLMPQPNNRKGGVFRFEECEYIDIRNVDIQYNTSNDMIALLSCKNVIIENSSFNWILDTGVHVYDSCDSVIVRNSRFTNTFLPENRQDIWYVYTIDIGLQSFDYVGEANRNITIENCFFENCAWEGVDSHGCNNLIIRNNTIHNAPRFIMAYGDDRNTVPRYYSNIVIENNYCYNDDGYSPTLRRGDKDTMFGISVASFGKSKQSNIVVANNRLVNTYLSKQSDASLVRTNNAKNVKVYNNKFERIITQETKNIAQLFVNTTNIEVLNNVLFCIDSNSALMGFSNCTGSAFNNSFIINTFAPSYIIYLDQNTYMRLDNNVGACETSELNIKTNNIVNKGEHVLSDNENLPNGSFYDQNFTTGNQITINGTCVSGDKFFTTDTYYVTPAIFGTLTVTDEASHTHTIECVVSWFEDSKVYINATIPASGTCTFKSISRTSKRMLVQNFTSQYEMSLSDIKNLSADTVIEQIKIVDSTSAINGSVFTLINNFEHAILLTTGKIYVYGRYNDKWYGVDLTERNVYN